MSKLFEVMDSLFKSNKNVILTERGHKYIRRLPDDEIERYDEFARTRYDKTYQDTRTGEKITKDYIPDYTVGNIFVDVIKHLAPKGYMFTVDNTTNESNYGKIVIYLKPENGSKRGYEVGEVKIKMVDDQPVATLEPDYSFTHSDDIDALFGKRPRAKTVAKDLAAEKGKKIKNDKDLEDFMAKNSNEIKKIIDRSKSNNNTREGFLAAIERQINKLPKGVLIKNLNESLETARQIIKDVPKYSPQWQGMVDYINKHWCDHYSDDSEEERNDRTGAINYISDEELMNNLDRSSIIRLARAGSSTLEDKVKEELKDVPKDKWDDEELDEAWDPSMPDWLKPFLLKRKKLRDQGGYNFGFTSESKIKEIPVPEHLNLNKLAKDYESQGKNLIVKIGNRAYWSQDRRWRDLTNYRIYSNMESIKDDIKEAPEGSVKLAVVDNYSKAIDDAYKKSRERDYAREGGVYRRSEVPRKPHSKWSWDDSYGIDLSKEVDKSGYQLNPDKYTDMLRTLNRKKAASSSTIDELKTGDYVKRFNDLGKQAAKFIGDNLSISYTDGDKYDGFKLNSDVVNDVKSLASKASYEIRRLMRSVDFIKSGEERDLGYFDSPEDEGVTNIDKWLKDQAKNVDKALNNFEKGISDIKKLKKLAHPKDDDSDWYDEDE